jgi:hypothetical protein
MTEALENIIDLSRYPLHQGDSAAWRALVRDKREQLKHKQYCRLPGFLLDEQRCQIVAAIEARLDQANRADNQRNVYLEQAHAESLPDEHPRNTFSRGCYHMFGAHLLDPESPLKTLYFSAMMQQFTAAIVGEDKLYPSDDPYQPVNVLCHGKGDRSAWHFDSNNAFTMTLMLQAPEAGGSFEIAPNTRSDENPNYAGVAGLLRGDRSGVECVARNEGELVIFRGCHSAHRVTPIEGERRRLMCVMVYEISEGVLGDPIVNETVYGIKQA